MILAMLVVAFGLQTVPAQAYSVSAWAPIYAGVDYATGYEPTTPQLMRAFAMRIDTWNPYISFYASHDNGTLPMEVTNQTNPAFLVEHGCKVAVNASYCSVTSPEADIWGLGISDGTVVSTGDYGGQYDCQFLITQANVASIAQNYDTPAGFWTAVSGNAYHLVNGTALGAQADLQPRTSIGISQDNRYVIWVCVDGRQSGWSLGATVYDMSLWQLSFGAYNAINLDGGGSTITTRSNDAGGYTILNQPCYGYARSNGVHLGVRSTALVNPPFNFDSHTMGWYSGNSASAVLWTNCCGWPGVIYADQTGDDCFVYSSATNFVGSANEVINVRVYPQGGSTANHDMQVFWKTNAENYFDAAKSSPVANYTAQDGWITVSCDVNNAKWTGQTINQIRLDFDQTNHANRWIVDYVQRGTPPATEIIMDNPAGVPTGAWSTGTMSSDKYGADYRYHSTATSSTDKFTWTPTITTPGAYQVFAWWPAGSNRSAAAPYTVYYNGGNTPVPCNQQTSGGVWNSLGTYNFSAGTSGRVELGVVAPTGFAVMADAVRFLKVPDPPVDMIIDNPAGTMVGTWATGTSTGKYGADYRYHSTNPSNTNSFTWTPTLPYAGNYTVYAWWPAGANRSNAAPYTITYSGGSALVPCNQQTLGGQWNSIGTYYFASGTGGNVTLRDNVTAGFNVMADAVRFVKP